jgi:phosphoribosylformylglycinamidine synthase
MAETIWQIAVRPRRAIDDARGRSVLAAARGAGFVGLREVSATRLYQIRGELGRESIEMLARELFVQPVLEDFELTERLAWPESKDALVEVHLLPGIMDPAALSATNAARELLDSRASGKSQSLEEIRTAWRYRLNGVRDLPELERLAQQVLANPCIEGIFLRGFGQSDPLPHEFPHAPEHDFVRQTVALAGMSDDELARLSRKAQLFLSVEEMRAAREHFAALGRNPTDLELETIAQTWSEHCVHKTMKSAVRYRGAGFGAEAGRTVEVTYENLLRDTIARATRELNLPWCLSVFEDNAGIIEFDERYGVAFKVETHNHPSAIEPYGGAATGAGGCIRDILGCGLGAKPIANTDVFCVADPAYDAGKLPPGVLHPRRVLRGIVSGVRDYGNRMGIPTVAGGLYFDNRYLANPLVYCGCVGLIPRDRIAKAPQIGDHVVVVGGRTGRDGIGGATFSSAELTDTHADEFAHAVQIGNAIEEKKVCDALLRARDVAGGCLYNAVTDCGAGGLSSAVGEMAAELGARIELAEVPLKYSGLRYNEIWLSEAQERMVLAVPERNLAELKRIFAEEEVELADIGTFSGDGRLHIHFRGEVVGDLDTAFLHEGLPKRVREASWSGPRSSSMPPMRTERAPASLSEALLAKLRSLNTCSRESIFRQYDLEVQAGTVIKPLVGKGEGPSDAAVLRPVPGSKRGIALGCGLCPQVSDRDPYLMAIRAIDEAVRNVVSVGADPQRIAILDNFCWGGCNDPEEMGSLVRACQGCYDAAIAFGTPFISGKDSLNNQFSLSPADAAQLGLPARIAIPGTLLISALGMIDDVNRCVTSDLKRPGNRLVYVSADLEGEGLKAAAALHRHVARLLASGSVRACHDVSDGGLAVCVAEMCIAGRRGASVELLQPQAKSALGLFDEILSAYVLEVDASFDSAGAPAHVTQCVIGQVSDHDRLSMSVSGAPLIELPVAELEVAWRNPLLDEEA